MESLRMYFKLISISFRSRMQFRADFFAGVIGVIGYNAVSLALIGIILSRFKNLNGWSFWEIVFLYSLWVLGHSIFSLAFWHMDELEYYLIQGTFDQFLIRPISPFLQFLGREINYMGVGDVIIGSAGLFLAMNNLGLEWAAWKWPYLLVVIIAGTLIEFSITLALACIAFWTGRSASTVNTVMSLSFMVQQYPLDMFGRWFRIATTLVVPVAFMNYYPSLLLLDKINLSDPWGWLSLMSPVVALLLLGIASVIWRSALRQYSSAGG